MRTVCSGAIALALIMIFTNGVSASPRDVVGTPFHGAADELAALGVLTGFPDGTFRPDSPITRAQLAAAATRALGLNITAQLERGSTLFPDVPAAHWASGYVNVCVDRGVLQGYPDGTFRPDQPVSHAEFLAILIRVLGYEPVTSGSWPGRYVAQALELGLIDNDDFDPYAVASRGHVALGLSRALTVRMLEPVTGAGTPYAPSVTLGQSSFGLIPVRGLVTATPQVFNPQVPPGSIVVRSGTTSRDYLLAEGTSLYGLLGREILGWSDGGTLTAIRSLTPQDCVLTGTVTGWQPQGTGARLRLDSRWYDLAASPVVYLNRILNPAAGLTGTEATVTLDDDGSVLLVDAFRWQGTWLVDSATGDGFRPRDEQGLLSARIRASSRQRIVIVKNGQQAWFADLKPHDVVRYVDSGDAMYLSVSDRTITGVLSGLTSYGTGGYSLDLGGSTLTTDRLTLSPDGNDFTFLAASASEVLRFSGAMVTAHLDHRGTVRHLSARIGPAETGWGLVLTPPADGRLEVLLATGRTQVNRYDDNTVWHGLTGANAGTHSASPAALAVGDVVSIAGPGETAVRVAEPDMPRVDPGEWVIDAANRLIRSRSTPGRVTIDTVIFDLSSQRIISWASFSQLSPGPDAAARWVIDDAGLSVLAVEGMRPAGPAPVSGAIIARVITPDGPSIRVLSGNRQAEYPFEEDTLITARNGSNEGEQSGRRTALGAGDFVRFSSAASGALRWITEPAAAQSGYVVSYDDTNGILVIRPVPGGAFDTVTYIVLKDAPIYDCSDDIWPAGPHALSGEVFVQVICGQPGIADAIKIVR